MENLPIIIYIAGLMGQLSIVLIVAIASLGTVLAITLVCAASEGELKSTKGFLSKLLSWVVFLSLVKCVLPTETSVYMMTGASVINDLAASDTGAKIRALINKKLDEALK